MTTTTDKKLEVRYAVEDFLEFMNRAHVGYCAARGWMEPDGLFVNDGGRKYLRIVRDGSQRMVHCFVDANTGDVYMAQTFNKPALNGARYNLLDAASRMTLHERWDPHGGYLYKRR